MKELLLLLCRYPYDETNWETLSRLIGEVTDWPKTLELINAHGIIALAAYNLKESRLESAVPSGFFAAVENGMMKNIARNTWLTEKWKEVDSVLTDSGIGHILLKGMALEHTIYESKGLRQMSDIDVFISQKEALKAWHILINHGFNFAVPKSFLHLAILPEAPRHLPALNKDGFTFEIHIKLINTPEFTSSYQDKLFDLAREINLSGRRALVLPERIHTEYLKYHFKLHRMSGECQIRIWQDIRMLLPNELTLFPMEFIMEPDQKLKHKFRKAIYRENINSIKGINKIIFVTGDVFPSVKWMKNRYHCSGLSTLLYYPNRLGKLLWLL